LPVLPVGTGKSAGYRFIGIEPNPPDQISSQATMPQDRQIISNQ